MKKVLITGVTGQDGSYLADFLLKELQNVPHRVYGMVRRTAKPDLGNLSNAIKNPNFELVTGDLTDSSSIDTLVKEIKPDYFVNLAAQSFVGSSWQIPETTFDIDATAIIRCLEAIRKHVPDCRFYNAGSSEEFGDVQYSPQDEKHQLRARSPYGAAKIAARQIVKVYRESYGLYAVQGYLFNHESERRGEEFVTRKITKGVAQIYAEIQEHKLRRGKKVITPIELGNLEARRDWSHAEDFVEGIWMMLNQENHSVWMKRAAKPYLDLDKLRKWYSHHITEYVLSSNETHTIREFITKSFDVAGVKIIDANPNRLPPTSNLEGFQVNYTLEDGTPLVVINPKFYRPAEVELLLGDSTKMRQELGWSPRVSFDQLVERMVENDIKLLTRNQK